MANTADQIFVLLKHWIESIFPAAAQPYIGVLLSVMRAVAQMISYEVPLLMSTVAIVMITGSLSLVKIVEVQNHYTWGLPHWYIFTPWGFAAFVMYCIAATAETNRSPFDLPEGE